MKGSFPINGMVNDSLFQESHPETSAGHVEIKHELP
jgi:hypothetical protein